MHPLKKQFQEKGFLVIPKAFPQPTIDELLVVTEKALHNKVFAYDHLAINETGHIHKIKYMFEKDPFFLKTLVHDAIFSLVLTLIDNPQTIVPTWEDMLIKIPYSGIPVTVHQDLALQCSKGTVFSVGIYLHDASHNPVYYLPGSHKLGRLTKDEVYEVYNTRKEEFVPVKAKVGDLVVHNVMTVHYSEENTSEYPRYTWYLEFRTKEQLLNDSPWDQEWVERRRALWVYALKNYRQEIDELIPDYTSLLPYMNPLQLRISHTNETVDYDMKSPYNHFA